MKRTTLPPSASTIAASDTVKASSYTPGSEAPPPLSMLEILCSGSRRSAVNVSVREIGYAPPRVGLIVPGDMKSLDSVRDVPGQDRISPDVFQSRAREITNKLSELKNTKALSTCIMLEETLKNIRMLKSKIEAIEDPVVSFDPQLFGDIVLSGTFSENDELTLEFIGGLKFTEQI